MEIFHVEIPVKIYAGCWPSPRISAFFAAANKMPRSLYENAFCLSLSSAIFLPRLAGFYINSLGIYFGNLGKNFDEKLTCKDAPFTSNFTKNKYYVYNYCCINFVAQILFAMPFALFSRQKLRFKKIAF